MELTVFLENESEEILKRYKANRAEVISMLNTLLARNKALAAKVELAKDLKEVKRYREYKDFIKAVKKNVYYSLRKYRRGEGDSVDIHVSTKERSEYLETFLSPLVENYSHVETIIDVGGGVFPLTFPFEKFPNLKDYIWIDRDKKAYDVLAALNNPKLKLYNHSIGEKSWGFYLPEGKNKFDLALMIKLVSVVGRQERDLLTTLASVPADTVLVTAPKEALTRRENIERRERAALKKFIQLTGKNIVSELEIENEFGYFIT